MKSLIQTLNNDAIRYNVGGVFSCYLRRPLFRVIFWYRVNCFIKRIHLLKYTIGTITYLLFRHLELKYGVFLNTNIHIGDGLYIEHGGCVYLNAEYIGNNLSVFHEVTLGVSPNKGKPYVNDNVTIYMGAKVIGNIIIGKNSVIGANSVVTKNVGDNHVVAGIPAKFIKYNTK